MELSAHRRIGKKESSCVCLTASARFRLQQIMLTTHALVSGAAVVGPSDKEGQGQDAQRWEGWHFLALGGILTALCGILTGGSLLSTDIFDVPAAEPNVKRIFSLLFLVLGPP